MGVCLKNKYERGRTKTLTMLASLFYVSHPMEISQTPK